MRTTEFEKGAIDEAMAMAARDVEDWRIDLLRGFADAQVERAERLEGEAAVLEATVGARDPQVVRRRAMAAWSAEVADEASRTAERQRAMPDVGSDELLLHGRVIDARGEPVPGIVIRIAAVDGQVPATLPAGSTDDIGDFAIVYDRDEIERARASGIDLHVALDDPRGRHIHTSREALTWDGARAEYFEFSMPTVHGRSPGKTPTGPRAAAAPAAGAPATSARPATARATTARASNPNATRATAAGAKTTGTKKTTGAKKAAGAKKAPGSTTRTRRTRKPPG